MSIEALKEQARRHEQKEEWQKALDQYRKAIGKLEAEDQPDIGLYNRVGDLFVRVGRLQDAVEHYVRAVDLYMESELPNNAIAVCKKIIRNLPNRNDAYLRMGQIRAQQGFLPDARVNFLTYAERMQQAGDLDESFRALVEFCDLAPDDVGVRITVAEQMAANGRPVEAVEQFTVAYHALMGKGEAVEASVLEDKIREMDPDVDLSVVPDAMSDAFMSGSGVEDGAIVTSFGEIGGPIGAHHADADELPGFETTAFHGGPAAHDIAAEDVGGGEEDEVGAKVPELPLMDFSTEDEEETEEEEAIQLPLMDFATEDEEEAEGEEEAVELPFMDFAAEEEGEAEREELPEFGTPSGEAFAEALEEETGKAPSLDALRARIEESPDDLELRQRLVETAYRSGDGEALAVAYLGLGESLLRAGQPARAKVALQQALQHDASNEAAKEALARIPGAVAPAEEVAAHEAYVDLGALVLEDGKEKTTRFVVAYEEPSGDEQADFAKMLSRFKEKVSENLDPDDVRAHHDLGTAYMEMGLLDEAVSEFQQALRASAVHLPTYELLGQAFMKMGRTDAAIRSLERALHVDCEIEDELIGIYYYLARAYEEVGKTEKALEFYDRVFSLDINFADVTERLRALR
jgi:tetratricopeptide (TPR) repeat protein